MSPAGADAEALADLFRVLLVGAIFLWLALNGLFFYVARLSPRPHSPRRAGALIVGGGVVFPAILLAILLGYGLSMMPDQRAPGAGLTIRVTGEQWWWRVEYWAEGAEAPVASANEIRLPAGRRTEIRLAADKVIHSFWIPSLAGKMDMFPGRETRMAVEPLRPGTYRGQCAEFCGASHALMAFEAVAMKPEAFEIWLEKEAGPAVQPEGDLARRGAEVFAAQGCGACHAIRGTRAEGRVGPDLTHLGGRRSLGAGVLEPTRENFARWIAHTDTVKPGVKMPAYGHLAEAELAALAAYLKGLR